MLEEVGRCERVVASNCGRGQRMGLENAGK